MKKIFCILASLMILGGCDTEQNLNREEAQKIWRNYSHGKYSMYQSKSCFCPYSDTTYQINVASDVVTSALNLSTNESVPKEHLGVFYTINQIFGMIEEAESNHIEPLEIKYDLQYGYPKKTLIGTLENDAGILVDCELFFEEEILK